MKRDLKKLKLPINSQIVISGMKGIDGGWFRSSGLLKFALQRRDVNGLLGEKDDTGYYNFDNHFNPKMRGWTKRYVMTGLSLDKPVFFFELKEKTNKLKQLEYALQWKGKTKNAHSLCQTKIFY